jgi:hypothetical protein
MKPISELPRLARVAISTMQSLLVTAMLGVVLFMSAGRLDWSQAWIFVAVYGTCNLISSFLLFTEAPELLDARRKKNKNIRKLDTNTALSGDVLPYPNNSRK